MRFDVLIGSYRWRRSGADDPQARMVQVGPVQVYFSYTTPVAFKVGSEPVVVRRNEWGPTTGSHLNAIDRGDRESRVPGDEFVRMLSERVGRFFYPRDLDADAPAHAVADWLRDRGMDAAADAVMRAESGAA